MFGNTEIATPAETFTEYFLRVRWATQHDRRIVISSLGLAMGRALEQQSPSDPVVVLEPGDPIALGRVVERLASSGDALLVDPYFRLDQLLLIIDRTVVTRVLTSERVDAEGLEGLQTSTERLTLPRPFEIRVASRELHDRYVIPATGAVTNIGSSMNGLGHVLTAMSSISDGADEVREMYERMWTESSVLASAGLAHQEG